MRRRKRQHVLIAASISMSVYCVLCTAISAAQTNTFPSSGNVGIGTTAPTSPLEVVGSTMLDGSGSVDTIHYIRRTDTGASAWMGIPGWRSSSFHIFGPTSTGNEEAASYENAEWIFWTGGIQRLTINPTGYIGIGTTTPGHTLDILTSQAQNASGGFQMTGSDSHSLGTYPSLGGGSYNNIVQSGDQAIIYSNGSMGNGGLVIAPWANALSGIRMNGNGYVGIGTTSPNYALDVAGNIHVSAPVIYQDGTQQVTAWTGVLCGGDYAEAMDAAGGKARYEPGDVLVLTVDGKEDVQKSAKPYSPLVAGVYATKPGVIGRRETLAQSKDDIPMAMVGVVPVKVSAQNGPIHRGDLLVTSSTPGYAMRGTDRSRLVGAVIGKAMGSLESGTGIIEVLVTLQ